MQTFVTVVHIITCVLIVLLVLIQSGKGAEISASFGGSSQTVFGSSGGANFFTRITQGAAAVFMLTSLTLTILGSRANRSVFETSPGAPSQAPAQPFNAPGGGTTIPGGTPGNPSNPANEGATGGAPAQNQNQPASGAKH